MTNGKVIVVRPHTRVAHKFEAPARMPDVCGKCCIFWAFADDMCRACMRAGRESTVLPMGVFGK
jgi:hypothetical protein